MTALFDESRHCQLLNILAQGGFVGEYIKLCQKYPHRNYADERPRLNFGQVTKLFLELDPTAKALKRWKMIEFGCEEVCGWIWTGSLVIKKYDTLDPMMKGVSQDGSLSVGSVWINLTSEARLLLPEAIRPSHDDYGRPKFDGSMKTMENIVADLVAMYERMKALIRQSWSP